MSVDLLEILKEGIIHEAHNRLCASALKKDKVKINYLPKGPGNIKTKEIVIDRYLPEEILGFITGYAQAESIHSKAGYFALSSCAIDNIQAFVESCTLLGITKSKWKATYIFSSKNNRVKEFIKRTCINDVKTYKPKVNNADSFYIFISGIIYYYLFKSLISGTKQFAINTRNRLIAKHFISAAIAGDGSINVCKRKRKYSPYYHLNSNMFITDEGCEVRKNYIEILNILNIYAWESGQRVFISNSFDNLLLILENDLLKNDIHKLRLYWLFLNKRRTRAFRKISRYTNISPRLRNSMIWANRQVEYGFLRRVGGKGINRYPFNYELTEKGKQVLYLITKAERDTNLLLKKYDIINVDDILDIKTRKGTKIILRG